MPLNLIQSTQVNFKPAERYPDGWHHSRSLIFFSFD